MSQCHVNVNVDILGQFDDNASMPKGSDLKRIQTYCNGLPSASSRYVTFRDLTRANAYKPLSKWTEADSLAYIRKLETRLKASTVLVQGRKLHAYFQWECDSIKRKQNPVVLKSLPKARDQRKPDALTASETHQLLKKVPKSTWLGARDRLAIALMLINGYRISTVTSLRWSDLEKRAEGWFLHTTGKGGVQTTRLVRSDLIQEFNRYHKLTFGVPLE